MLLLASSVCGLFKWRQFEPEMILLAVGWYLRFSLSYRDVEELLAERSLRVDHVTVWRWVQRFLTKALGGENHPEPRVINTDEHAGYPPAIVRLKAKEALEEDCWHRPVQ
jgi:transposase-like protein